ncbi:MAG: GIY-YIG nuclease family protein [Candidatus Marinimicrobia bacterium]|nr:GIY-YIG nuclease family protein [Candidatus Neomarinimicrobiota bacterium]
MWQVYVLKSLKDNNYYVGMSENVNRHIKEHNTGKVRSTKYRIPFKLIYVEKCIDRASARKCEKYLKSAAGRRYLHNKIR